MLPEGGCPKAVLPGDRPEVEPESISHMPETGKTQEAVPEKRGNFVHRLQRLARRQRIFADRYRALYERSPLALFELDEQGRINRANARFLALLRGRPESFLGRRLSDLLHPAFRDAECEGAAELLMLPDAPSLLLPLQDGSGEVVWMQVTNVRLSDGEQAGGVLCVGVDMTGQRRADEARRLALDAEARAVAERDQRLAERTRDAQRMEAIGRLAGGVAHDFNNRLTVILGNANLIRFASPPDSAVARQVDVIERSAIQAAQLTQQLLGFARRDRTQHKPLDLHRVIAEALAQLNPAHHARIRLLQELAATAFWVRGDLMQLRQVVLNLISHGFEAMPQGGTLHLSTSNVELDTDACQLREGLVPGAYLALRVRDTGSGMPPEELRTIFEPFFTPRRHGRAAGMGLAVVYNTVRNHGGAMEVASARNQGVMFTAYLPVCPCPAAAAPLAAPATGGALRRVLVVDDEDGVRAVMVGILRQLGYETVTAGNGLEAVEYYRVHAAAVDVVLVDMQMPVMDGQACCRELRRLNPDVNVLVMTGCAGGASPTDTVVPGARGYLQKPFAAEVLAQELQRVLA